MKPQIIENFISKETCEYINSYMKKSNLLDSDGKCIIYVNKDSGANAVCMGWTPEIFSLLNSFKNEGMQNSLIYDLFNLIGKNMCRVFGFRDSEIIYETSHYKCFGVEKIGTGFGSDKVGENGQNPHCDHWGDGGKIYTAVLYLNDQYEGGKITFYKNLELDNPISYNPKTGSLIFFDGHTSHSVENVVSGERSSIVLHIRHKEMKRIA
jgi:hypothetical protein